MTYEAEEALSGWQAPVEELSEALLLTLLHRHDAIDALALAATDRHWAATITGADHCWSDAVKYRWAVWREVNSLPGPSGVKLWLSEAAQGEKEGREEEVVERMDTCHDVSSWREVYLIWRSSVNRAVDAALTAATLHSSPEDRKEGNALCNLWARPLTQDIEFPSWEKALEAMRRARLGPEDVALHFLSSDRALVNFLGVHYLMMEPWAAEKSAGLPPTVAHYPKESVPFVQSLLNHYGCAHKRVVVRWWELGMLAMGVGWRTNDQMHTVGATIGSILKRSDFWRMLLRGVQLEVRRIVISEE
eukprot:CAMPEP_0177758696 /NCGR_PEP_ID=MMETSP0491_2-20121128/4327_1 /TAXON_ID=63592 /ORGANISM="Tetraselmis chuii, Strain PLY429" /LENGTH=303 /DNA_ID=CAMNT_0019274457 /DNA_START=142 /DNA_END=1053 /DNA_ORIENTATION=+